MKYWGRAGCGRCEFKDREHIFRRKNIAFFQTYCVDSRVPDSACAGTAFLTGVKSNLGTVAMHPTVKRGDCVATSDKVKQLESIAKWALDAGKVVGFATTSRVTAGSSAALYGHSADARWENDADVTAAGCNPAEVRDIAYQLIHGEVGKRFTVIFGGGRKNFIPSTATDASGARGLRADGKNLIEEWKQSKTTGNAVYITTGVSESNWAIRANFIRISRSADLG